jgi:hypothetical protein
MTTAIDAPYPQAQREVGLRRDGTLQQEGGRLLVTVSGGDLFLEDIEKLKEEGI